MPISRMQQPRQMYGLGSIVKSVGKAVKGAVKGAADLVKSDAGKALGLAALSFGIPGTQFGGLFGRSAVPSIFGKYGIGETLSGLPGASAVSNFFGGEKTLGKTLGVMAGGSLLGGLLNQAEQEGDPEGITRDVGALRNKLTQAYKLQRTFSDAPDEEAAIAAQVESDLSEYQQDVARTNVMNGGRMGYALGDRAEQNAIQASGIMNLPLNQNPVGVTELDLRETGGFIPPVGVKEKADDIPAMLSNNEFVFTADAVRGMGGGDVNKGAQRLYDQMKMLEKGGRV